jgi:hypothetical protein
MKVAAVCIYKELDRFQDCSTLSNVKEKILKNFKESQSPTRKL